MSEDNLFPLPLTNFEAALLADDRPAYPMTVFCRLRFTGFLKLKALQTAVENVIQRHPLLRATVSRTRLGRLVWLEKTGWRPVIQRQTKLNPSGLPNMAFLDLTQEPGIRWWIITRPDGHDLVIQAHHCSVDGMGMDLVVEDLLVSYASNLGIQNNNALLRPLNPQRLLHRGTPKLTSGKFLSLALKQLPGLVGVYEFLRRSPVPLMGNSSTLCQSASTPDTFPAILGYEFDIGVTMKIRAAAKSMRVTVNMILLRDLFLAMALWRKKWRIGSSQDWLRIAIPINLRGSAEKTMPVSNSVSMIFPERQTVDFEDEYLLLESIREQMWLIKRFQLQYTYIFSLGMTRLVPGLMSRVAQADKCQATTYLSNVDDFLAQAQLPNKNGRLVCGNVVLESVDLASVLRPHTNAGFLVHSYAGQLRLTLQYDSRVISVKQAGELLDMYTRQIERTIRNNNGG